MTPAEKEELLCLVGAIEMACGRAYACTSILDLTSATNGIALAVQGLQQEVDRLALEEWNRTIDFEED